MELSMINSNDEGVLKGCQGYSFSGPCMVRNSLLQTVLASLAIEWMCQVPELYGQ